MAERNDKQRDLTDKVRKAEARKMRVRIKGKESAWFGLGTMGMVGWAVAVPTLLGVLLGWWLDANWPSDRYSWTLVFLLAGLCLGCANAWFWISRERDTIQREREEDGS
jgi:ATP synthase protein I